MDVNPANESEESVQPNTRRGLYFLVAVSLACLIPQVWTGPLFAWQAGIGEGLRYMIPAVVMVSVLLAFVFLGYQSARVLLGCLVLVEAGYVSATAASLWQRLFEEHPEWMVELDHDLSLLRLSAFTASILIGCGVALITSPSIRDWVDSAREKRCRSSSRRSASPSDL
jgi:hypothetical protein